MDYNLYGMNLIHASGVKFRAPVRLLAGMYVKHKTRLFQLALNFDKPPMARNKLVRQKD